MNSEELSSLGFIFKQNDTYLSQSAWQSYFDEALPNGFLDHVCKYNTGTQKLDLIVSSAFIEGLKFTNSQSSYNGPTQAEYDSLYAFVCTSSNIKLMRFSGLASNEAGYKLLLARVLYTYALNPKMIGSALNSYYNLGYNTILPVAYAVYGVGFWDLSRLIKRSGDVAQVSIVATDTDVVTTVNPPYCGHLSQYGLAQIYGGHKYTIEIASDYSQSEYILYPVPGCDMQSATIHIKNNSGNVILIKIPETYRGLTFEYVHDGVWVESNDVITYSLADEGDIVITLSQAYQLNPFRDETTVSVTGYEISQNLKNNDPGEGYTKAEANALFETLADAAGKVDASDLGSLAYMDTEDLGGLAVKDKADYETDIENLPTLGTMAAENDAPSDIKVYGRRQEDWCPIIQDAELVSKFVSKFDSTSVADEYSDDSLYSYTVGDLVIYESELYRYEYNLVNLEATALSASGSITVGKYYNNNSSLYLALVSASYSTSSVANAITNLLENNYITAVTIKELTPFGKYEVGNIAYEYNNGYQFYRLTDEYGYFAPVTIESLYYSKREIDTALSGKADTLVFDDTPTEGSDNLVKSGGIYDALLEKSTSIIADDYDSTATYHAGDLAAFDGVLKRYVYTKTQLTVIPLMRSYQASSGTYISYEKNLWCTSSSVTWNEDTVEEAYDFVVYHPTIFVPVEYEIYNPQKTYESGSVVKSGEYFYTTTSTLSFVEVNVDELIDEKLTIAAFLNAFGVIDADITSIASAIDDILDSKASVQSPVFTGTPEAPTPTSGDNSKKISTTAFVQTAIASKANLNSPTFTGAPKAPTPSISDNSTKLATTEFVQSVVSGIVLPTDTDFIYYVNNGTGSDDNDGSSVTPFKTIQKAIDSIPYCGHGTIHVSTGSYQAPITISGKAIRIETMHDGIVNFWNNNGGSLTHSLNVINGSTVTLNGDFEIWSMYGSSVYVSEDSSLFYDNYNSADTLKCTLYISSTATIKSIVDIYGKFISVGKVYLEIDSEEGLDPTNTTGIEAINGGYVNIGDIEVNSHFVNASVFGSNTGSLIVYQSVTGQYGTLHTYIGLGSEPRGSLIASGEYYNKTEINTLLSGKANTTDMTSALALKANLASPTFTGTPKAPTASNGTNSTQLATTAFVQNTLASNGLFASSNIYVDGTNGNDSTGTGAQSSPFKTIQKAVNSGLATAPVTIRIAPGAYNESVTINGKNIILQGTSNTEIRVTGQGIYPAFTVNNGGKLRLRGVFTLMANGNIGLSIQNNSSVIHERVDTSDVLAVNPLSTSSAGKGIILNNNSKFTAENKVTVTIPNSGNTSYAVYSENGGHISIGILNVSMPTGSNGGVVLYATRTTALIGSVTGTYQTELSQTNSIVKVGNTIR